MSGKMKFNMQEYTSLRAEMIQRLATVNAQSHTAIITIITVFGAGVALRYNVPENADKNIAEFVSFNIIRSFVFLIPIIYLLPLAVKSGENLIQIASLSAYIRVFYDYLSPDDGLMNWETSKNILSNANVDRGKKSNIMKFYNEEYTVLACISFALYIFFSIVAAVALKSAIRKEFFVLLIVGDVIIDILALVVIAFIHISSGMKNTLMKYTPIYMDGYIKRAVQLGIIQVYDMKIVQAELDPYKSIDRESWYL